MTATPGDTRTAGTIGTLKWPVRSVVSRQMRMDSVKQFVDIELQIDVTPSASASKWIDRGLQRRQGNQSALPEQSSLPTPAENAFKMRNCFKSKAVQASSDAAMELKAAAQMFSKVETADPALWYIGIRDQDI